jgi:hypothetical protein
MAFQPMLHYSNANIVFIERIKRPERNQGNLKKSLSKNLVLKVNFKGEGAEVSLLI